MLFIALVWFILEHNMVSKGDCVTVYRDNKPICEYELSERGEYSVLDDDNNIIIRFKIDNGSVNVYEASCPDKYCVNQKKITENGETIVCIPNRVVLKVSGSDLATDINQTSEEIDATSY